jgi:hypothetical protein
MNMTSVDLKRFDLQMRQWVEYLVDSVRIEHRLTGNIASLIYEDIKNISPDSRAELIESISNPIPIENRLEKLCAFQGWADIANNLSKNPFITRAQIIVQNYICFVYLNDSCFKNLKKYVQNGSVTKKCCNFLINNPVRAFRNAIAHSNWKYSDDFSEIIFYAKKGHSDADPIIELRVSNVDLNFWQFLARCTAYTAFLTLTHDSKQ